MASTIRYPLLSVRECDWDGDMLKATLFSSYLKPFKCLQDLKIELGYAQTKFNAEAALIVLNW